MIATERDRAMTVIEAILAGSTADETEVAIGGGRAAVTRFAANQVHQTVDEEWSRVRIRTVLIDEAGQARSAATTTDRTDPDGLSICLGHAMALAGAAPSVPDWPGLPFPQDLETTVAQAPGFFDGPTADTGPAFRADAAATAILPCRRRGLTAAGFYRTAVGSIGGYGSAGVTAVGNSNGLRRFHAPTEAEFTCSITTPSNATSWVTERQHRRADVDIDALAARAIDRAWLGNRPETLAPGEYRVLLEPDAVRALLAFTLGGFSARAIREGRSFLAARHGDTVLDPRFVLRADPYHPDLLGRPFDPGGVPTRTVTLLADGAPVDAVYERAEARAVGRLPDGYDPARPSSADAVARNLVLEGGVGTLDDLIARNPDCLLVTRLWYNRLVDALPLSVAGMTRDGVVEMRGGQIRRSLHDMRYNVSVAALLQNIVDASASVRTGDMMMPALVVDGFRLSGGGSSE